MKTRNHTISTVTRMLGGEYKEYGWRDCGWNVGVYEARIEDCFGVTMVYAEGKTMRDARGTLVNKLRWTAKAILSDEWEFEG